jgi:type IV pilus assembly protein PilW
MKNSNLASQHSHMSAQRGFTLIELMIAIAIGLFLIGGLLTLVQAMKRTSGVQSGLSQLQDNQRMAMTLMTDVIQSTGYFTNPTVNTAAASFPILSPFTYAGQALFGGGAYTNLAAGGQTLSVRYMTSGSDAVINCTGNPSAVAAQLINTFSIDANGNLQCTLTKIVGAVTTTTTVPLISGLSSMQIYYGVQSNTTVSTNSIDTYMDGATVAAGNYWPKVTSVKITLNFINPLYGQPGQTNASQKYVAFTRIVDVMNKTGVTT